jgi:hypothetical protein
MATSLHDDGWQLREMNWYAPINPDVIFSSPEPSILRIESSYPSVGSGYIFTHFRRADLDGKTLQVRWNEFYSYPDERDFKILWLCVFDKVFTRSEMTNYFAEDRNREPMMDTTNIFAAFYPGPLGAPAGWYGWRVDTSGTLDLSSWTSEYVTVLLRLGDSWAMQTSIGEFDWIRILDGQGNEVYSYDFNGSPLMEVTGTYNDFGTFVESVQNLPAVGVQSSSTDIICIRPGFCFTANISIANVTQLYGYGLKLAYDSNLLELMTVQLFTPESWGSNYFVAKNEKIEGGYWIALTAIPPAAPFNGSTMTATLRFGINGETYDLLVGKTVQTSLHLYETTLGDDHGNAIPHFCRDTSVTIHIPLIGDVNGDGKVDVLDLIRVAIKMGNTGSPGWIIEDVNYDGRINVLDLIMVATNMGKIAN